MFSMRSTAAGSTVPAPLSLGAPEEDGRVGSSGGERREPEPEGRARRSDRDALQPLVALGVTPTAAREVIAEHDTQRVVDALDGAGSASGRLLRSVLTARRSSTAVEQVGCIRRVRG
jgi:hypothetical protein